MINTTMVNHGQTMVIHDQLTMINHGDLTLVNSNYKLKRVLVPAWLAGHGSAMGTMFLKNGTMADHGQLWYI